jgi:hypothetical protein
VTTPRNPDPETYRFVYEEARGWLERQEKALDELRTRTGVLIAAGAVVVSFLGEAAGKDGYGPSAIVGIVAFVIASGLWIAVLVPVPGWTFGNDVKSLFKDYIEADDPASMVETYRDLALHHAGHIDANAKRLDVLYWAFRIGAALLVVQVVSLLLDVPV